MTLACDLVAAPSNYPTPIVYGPDFPQFKMLMRYGRQVFESRTNQNLFLEADDLFGDFTDSGTFTMARFLGKRASWQDCASLLFDLIAVEEDNFDWIGVLAEPNWAACPACSDLISYCNNSPAQRSFLASWWRTQYAVRLADALDAWLDWVRRVGESRGKRVRDVVTARGASGFVFALVDLVFDFPALVPEVWLNYAGWDKTAQEEAHLNENPQRVDFVLLGEGKKCVVEVDGPSHYAEYDEGERNYTVSEPRYARNLKIERSLRRQGWEIYRFANIEVLGASDDDFAELAQDLPGYTGYSIIGPGHDVVSAHKVSSASTAGTTPYPRVVE
jgi:hypothetical protein